MIRLSFGGEYPPLAGVVLAIVAGAVAYSLYRKETHDLPKGPAMTLPLLRAVGVVLLVLMLTKPSLKLRHTDGRQTKVLIFVDASQSMQSTDSEMSVTRKLAVARSLHWLPYTRENDATESTAEKLALAGREFKNAIDGKLASNRETSTALNQYIALIDLVLGQALDGGLTLKQKQEMERELIEPAKRYVKSLNVSDPKVHPPSRDCLSLLESSFRWETTFSLLARAKAVEQVGSERKVSATLEHFAHTDRMERVRALLLDGANEGLLSALAPNFSMELFSLEGPHAQLLWKSEHGMESLPTQLPSPDSTITDLGAPILNQMSPSKGSAADNKKGLTAVVLLSDGRHNAKGDAVAAAKLLGSDGIPIYCIGIGSATRTEDLAIAAIEAPGTVYFEDRVSGLVSIRDDMKPGQPYNLQFKFGEKIVWQKELFTSQGGLLKVPFDFAVRELVESSLNDGNGNKTVVPLSLEASVSVLPQEREARNNTANLLVQASKGKRGILLLDGRPRWDMHYIRTLFERDPQWETNSLTLAPDNQSWLRGLSPGTFPADQETLNHYEMIILGDVPSSAFSNKELLWLEEFVGKRGGGLLFLDGARHFLSQYESSPLQRLLPVTFKDDSVEPNESPVTSLELTDRGKSVAALQLEENQPNPSEQWSRLPTPNQLRRCEALPGTETLLEGVAGGRRNPALVLKNHGAGRAAYMGFDETWRWRKGVAGKFQERFWNQITNLLAAQTFAVMDERLALDTDSFNYTPGSVANLRARIRDDKRRTNLAGALWSGGKKVATVTLLPVPGSPDLFAARTAPLASGTYDFGVEGIDGSAPEKMRVSFRVQPEQTGELNDLTLNEELLRDLAAVSNGKYLREEDARLLPSLMGGLKTGGAVESEVILWQSYGLFALVIGIFATEWTLRKRYGLL